MADTFVNDPASDSDVMIRLEGLGKRYSGQDVDAVAPLDLEIRRGEFVVFVGPSGCGKTTTLRMVNRLVEPTYGRIWIDGRDVTHADPDELRRKIGYVIQQVGLIPHMTVAQNVGLVPKLLGWSKAKTAPRVDELLDLVGLDPGSFRSRYPKQLSGGQQQRVGVARALAADPPVMVMDEPFGAIDPITRERLQDEFLNLQKRIRKTIVFVTHDVNEALKLGDRIAIFADGSRLAQYATPLEILAHPADEYVRSFIGTGAAIRRLSLLTLADITGTAAALPATGAVRLSPDVTVYAALDEMLATGADRVVIAGDAIHPERTSTLRDLLTAASRVEGSP